MNDTEKKLQGLDEWFAAKKVEQEINGSRDALIDRLIAAVPPQRKPGGVTSLEMAKIWDITRSGARQRLEKMVDSGALVRRVVVSRFGNTVVYYDADEWAEWESEE